MWKAISEYKRIDKMGRSKITKNTIGIFMLAVLLLAMLATVPAGSVKADTDYDQIDLALSGEGAVSWNITGIMPCMSGTKTIILENVAPNAIDGEVIVWLSNIDSNDGIDSEPELDVDVTEGGELDENLLIGLTVSDNLDTNMATSGDTILPTTIFNFPQSIGDATPYIHIDLGAGDTITLTFDWELPCETGNEAQGDVLIFDINFYLEDFLDEPPDEPDEPDLPTIPTFEEPTGEVASLGCECPNTLRVEASPCLCTAASNVDLGEFPACYEEGVVAVTNDAPLIFPIGNTIVTWTMTDIDGNRWTCEQVVTVRAGDFFFEIDMLGELTEIEVACPDNGVVKTYIVSDPDNDHFLTLEKGTHVVCPESTQCVPYPEIIIMTPSDEAFELPDDMALIGLAYDFTGYADKETLTPMCSYVEFDRPVIVQLSYDPDDPLIGNSVPFIAYYDPETGTWKPTDTVPGMVAEVGMASGMTEHFSTFAVMVDTSGGLAAGFNWWIILAIILGILLIFLLARNRRRKQQQQQAA